MSMLAEGIKEIKYIVLFDVETGSELKRFKDIIDDQVGLSIRLNGRILISSGFTIKLKLL